MRFLFLDARRVSLKHDGADGHAINTDYTFPVGPSVQTGE